MNKQFPLVSVITVCRNSEDSIEATMLSILEQNYSHIEYIIIDGLSTDSTFAKVAARGSEFTTKGIKFECLSERDNGIYDAMNKGIAKSTGEWLIFMNSGDVFYNANVLLDTFSKDIENNDMVIYGDTLAKNKGTIINSPKRITKGFFFTDTICHQSIFFNIRSFTTVGVFNLSYKIIADRVWLLQAAILNIPFKYISLSVSVWDEEGFSKDNINIYAEENAFLKRTFFSKTERFFYLWKFRISRLFT